MAGYQRKSTGAFVPYIHEREDGLALRQWIRTRPFYNGELFLFGGSYVASLHYTTAPFESDIKGAVFEVQDSERYNLWYRNGQMRKGHANWHFGLYKNKCGLNKSFNIMSFSERPLKGLSERVLGNRAEDFEQMLAAPFPSDEFWNTRSGSASMRDALKNAKIPVLLTTGFYDIFTGGHALFTVDVVWHYDAGLTKLHAMTDGYGIIPMPKYDENQKEYITGVQDAYNVLSIMECGADQDFAMISAVVDVATDVSVSFHN